MILIGVTGAEDNAERCSGLGKKLLMIRATLALT